MKITVSIGGDSFAFESDPSEPADLGAVATLLTAFVTGRGPDPDQTEVDRATVTLDASSRQLAEAIGRSEVPESRGT